MLLAGMGWPLAEAYHPAALLSKDSTTWKRTMQGPGLQPVHDEFKVQLLTLQLVSLCYHQAAASAKQDLKWLCCQPKYLLNTHSG